MIPQRLMAIESVVELHEMQNVLSEMYDNYRHRTNSTHCELCLKYKKRRYDIQDNYERCAQCPWLIFEGIRCDDWFRYVDNMRSNPGKPIYNQHVARRIKMLDKWMCLIEERINCFMQNKS